MEVGRKGAAMGSDTQEDRKAVFAKQALGHLDAMYAVALRLTCNDKEAEDLVQDSFLRAYRFYEKFEPGTNLKAWLLKIQMNVFLNRVKKSSSRPALVDFDTLEDMLGEADDGAAGVSSSSEHFRELLDDDVAHALDELPLEYRTPVLLSAVEDLSYKEIADIMACPVGTVMSRLYRGRKMLERSLRAYAQSIGFLKGREA
jgi:RNA polymerase sigma-70 factor, ECF subfamily